MENILWCITGGGAFLRELAGIFLRIKREYSVKITLCFSRWGYEVSRIYGLFPLLEKIASKKYYEEWFVEDEGFYYVGRINMGRYRLVVIAPATSNSIAKIVNGIADTLPTLVFAEAGKSDIPVVVLPTDYPSKDGLLVSETPCYIDYTLCRCLEEGRECPVINYCPVNAIYVVEDKPRIDLSKCIGCEICVSKCIYGAIKCWEKIYLKPRPVDLYNIDRLRMFDNVYIIDSPEKLYKVFREVMVK